MGSLGDYTENKLLDHVLKVAAFTQPTNLYVALSTADPTDDGSGVAEPSGGSYARALCNTWDAAASRATANTGAVTFAEATGSWGTISHFAIFDAVTGGNMIGHGALSASKAVASGDTASFAAGGLDVTFSAGDISDYLANALLDHLFKNTAYTVPTNIYLALATVTITDSDTGSTITEPGGGSYARDLNNTWDTAAAGASANTGAIDFVEATASWGTVTDVALTDALTAGNMLQYTALDTGKAIGNGDTAHFDAGALDITLS